MSTQLRRTAALVALTVAPLVALGTTSAFAASAHFIRTPTDSATTTTNSVTLSASFKAAGLGNAPTATFSLFATATGTFGCFTKSGNHPQASNKEGPVQITGTTTVDVRNGSTSGTVTATLGTSLTCPGGQHSQVISYSFTNVTLNGPQGLTASLNDVTSS